MKLKTHFLAISLALACSSVFAQLDSYYVVIGGFAIEENAQKFVERAHGLNIPAIYSLNSERNLYYVFVRFTPDKGDAYKTLKRMQEEGFNDAWVFRGDLAIGLDHSTIAKEEKVQLAEPKVSESIEIKEPFIPETGENDSIGEQGLKLVLNEKVETTPAKPAGRPFIFKLINETNGQSVTGQVLLLESQRANQYRGYNSNEKVYVVPPSNSGGKWYIACRVIGFQPLRKSFTYNEAQKIAGASLGADEEVIVPLPLKRVKKGDYIEMDEVKFYENSNILTPGSERELAELVAMMEENPEYRIKLHGHTNGNHIREIISMGDSQNHFELDPSANKRYEGTAKQLSMMRAETVRSYLISKGVNGSRVTFRGEGGKQPIFDPTGTAAANNARVEVEITKH